MNRTEKSSNRRAFIKKMSAIGGMSAYATYLANAGVLSGSGYPSDEFGNYLNVFPKEKTSKPLDKVNIHSSKKGRLKVMDGASKLYVNQKIDGDAHITAGGTLGTHIVLLMDEKDHLLDISKFHVQGKTEIKCQNHRYEELFDILHWIITRSVDLTNYGGRIYTLTNGWFQDNVHVMKSIKYFRKDQQSFMDLFTIGQYESGMIPDFFRSSNATKKYYIQRFSEKFINYDDDKPGFFVKVPVENMSEFHYLEGLYYVWKATGDDDWMKSKLDAAIKAVDYELTSKYTWSKKFNLIKRSYTIDIWDFLPDEEAERLGNDIMANDPDKSKYGILFADNIGMAVGCRYLSEMLGHVGNYAEAQRMRDIGNELMDRTYALCWNGSFFTHRVPEDPNEHFDFGDTDTSVQVTLSNAYVLNKGVDHEKCVEIIKTYQRIKEEMPASSPGEWYMCYPPYEKGWHMDKWEYMNGGVSPIVAGELAHGAFEHGYENYAVDILERVYKLAKAHGDNLHCIYRGAMPEIPKREYDTVNFTDYANADIKSQGKKDVPEWINEEGDDLDGFPTGLQEFEHVKFNIIDPANNKRKACMGLSGEKGYSQRVNIPLQKQAASLYLLHTMHDPYFTISHSAVPKGRYYAGNYKLTYEDGSEHIQHITNDQVGFFHFPVSLQDYEWPRHNSGYYYKVAWRGGNKVCNDVGLYITGFDNPHPSKTIKNIEFEAAGTDTKWMIVGITLSDKPAFLMPSDVSFGAPDNWASAAIMYAMVEGLAGVKDTGVAFNKALISPRWEPANVTKARSMVKYEDSQGYVAYQYEYDRNKDIITLLFTGTSEKTDIQILLPENKTITQASIENVEADYTITEIEQSTYAGFKVGGSGVNKLKLKLQ